MFSGVYCKWLLEGHPHSLLKLRLLGATIFPVTEGCQYDGFLVYDGQGVHKRKIGIN